MQTPAAILLDMDGVLFHGTTRLPGARRFLQAIASIPHCFVTNNPIRSEERVAAHFAAIGLPAPQPSRVITSARATAAWLASECPGFRYFAVGATGLHEALAELGTEDPDNAEFVVIGEGPGLDFDTLTRGLNLIVQRGARLVCTNPDQSVDDAGDDGVHRVLPGGGALVAPFAVASGVEPEYVGKPYPRLFEMACTRLAVDAQACVMVGDRPDTDIAGAQALGMQTALVRSGRFAPGRRLPDGVRPDWDVADLPQLLAVWDRAFPGWLAGGA